MTKKRFVKLVMGARDSRNEAERAAEAARRHRIPYGAYFPIVEESAREWAAVRALSRVFQEASVSTEEAAKSFNNIFLGRPFQIEGAAAPGREK